MDAGLPVFAILNPGNELINIIEENKIGDYSTGLDVCELEVKLKELLLSLPRTNELKRYPVSRTQGQPLLLLVTATELQHSRERADRLIGALSSKNGCRGRCAFSKNELIFLK